MITRSKLVLSALVLSLFWQSSALKLGEDFKKLTSNLAVRFPLIPPDVINETLIVSPLSVALALGLIQQGAGGNSAKQISSLLGLGPEESKSYFRTVLDYVQETTSDKVLRWSNKMFVRNDLEIDADYQENIEKNFKMTTQKVDFNLDDFSNSMHDWIGSVMEDNIQDAVSPNFSTRDTNIVLATAVSFKDEWDTPFNVRYTDDDAFHVNETMNVTVPFMVYNNRNTTMGQNDEKGFKWIRLGYSESSSTYMLFVLPTKRFGLSELIENLSPEDLFQMQSESKTEMVDIVIPKFNLTTHKLLKDNLKKLGVVDIFGEEANLSGMIKSVDKITISDISHNCKIEINEKGTTASGVTSVNVQFLSGSMAYPDNAVFKVDEPFLIVIYEENISFPYFYGQVYNPRS